MNSEDILFSVVNYYRYLGTREQQHTLGMIVDMWTTIRGFSLASAWMEIYKKQEKKTKKTTCITFTYVQVESSGRMCVWLAAMYCITVIWLHIHISSFLLRVN